ncbi:hypothetical protein DL766_006948 [Monosporascus sp. MC13-8B]|uniref:BAH domain-containing protein n=1 Tax=Monosporascus cannonballus TaxID=155416 RepID=A0ABY0GWK8_9PEZI|nr:hypothetical protein DL762_008282 [Monosporascus cannonballus]RYO84141.1 hypothetical protein DL763_007570 [Monosporascus cannonballus]RYP25680.1 hypothetical protein DL766_006948 [Monosporascus sp. MC13-8B]
MATTRKRPRPEEETQVECPFTVTYPDSDKTKEKTRSYWIQPSRWIHMTRYKRFVLHNVRYSYGDFVFVANSSTVKRRKDPDGKMSDPDWVAKILEIRASDGSHVYARALLNTYERLSADKPHKSAPIKEEPKRLLSPNESGAVQTARHLTDMDHEKQQTSIELVVVENGEAVKTDHSMTGAVAFGTNSKNGGRPRKWEPSGPSKARPYEKLFEAVIRNNPFVIEIRDLRKNVTGKKEWTESIDCLSPDRDSISAARVSPRFTATSDQKPVAELHLSRTKNVHVCYAPKEAGYYYHSTAQAYG